MKKILLIIFAFVITAQSSKAQSYPHILDRSCWYVNVFDFSGSFSYWLIPKGDTTIGAYTYKIFVDSPNYNFIHPEIIREDVAQKKIVKFNWGAGSGEFLVFDFSKRLLDTVDFLWGPRYYVYSEDTITLSTGLRRRRMTLKSVNPLVGGQYWIEGVGALQHPLCSENELPSDPSFTTKCSYQNGRLIYSNGSPGTCPPPPKIEELDLSEKNWFPNPSSSLATIRLDKELSNAVLKIYNASGQLVRELKSISGTTISLNTDNLNNGLYIILLTQENKTVISSRLFVLH
jgi:hypothetical protein